MTENEDGQEEPPIPTPPQEINNADVRRIWEEHGLDRKQFAELLGVSYSLLDKVERGKRNVSQKLSEKIRGLLK